MDKMTNNDLQNNTHQANDRVTRTALKTGGELMYSGRVSSSCSTCDIRSKVTPINKALLKDNDRGRRKSILGNGFKATFNNILVTCFLRRSILLLGLIGVTLERMSQVEQELLTLPEYMSSPPVFSAVRVTRSLA
jgi:hypothetical protein